MKTERNGYRYLYVIEISHQGEINDDPTHIRNYTMLIRSFHLGIIYFAHKVRIQIYLNEINIIQNIMPLSHLYYIKRKMEKLNTIAYRVVYR